MEFINKNNILLSFCILVFTVSSCRSKSTIIKDISLIKSYSVKEIIKFDYDGRSLTDDALLSTIFKFEEDFKGSIMQEIEERKIYYVKDYKREYGKELTFGYLFDNRNFYLNSGNVIFILHVLPNDHFDRMIVINFDKSIMIITVW